MRPKDASALDFLRIVLSLLPNLRKSILIILVGAIVYESVRLIPPYLIKLVIDGIFGTATFTELSWLIGGIFLVLMIIIVMETVFLYVTANTAITQKKTIVQDAFRKLLDLPMSWHESQNTGSTISKIVNSSRYADDLVWFLSNDILPALVQMILTGLFLLWVDWRVGLVYWLFLPVILYVIDRNAQTVQPFRRKYHGKFDDSVKEFAQALYNIQAVKDFTGETFERKRQNSLLSKFWFWWMKRNKLERNALFLRGTLNTIVRVSIFLLTIWLVLEGSLTPGDLVLIFTLTEKAFINLHRLGRIYSFMGDTHESLARALEIQQTPNTLLDTGMKKPKPGSFAFEKVDFGYTDELVLKNVSLAFPEKKTTALVGPSGGGKSTIVKLLMRHYDPTNGSITLGGIDLRDMPIQLLRKRIAFVSQHTELFDRSIAENIAYGDPKAPRKAIIKAAKQANAHIFISSFKNGYDTIVGEKGVRLSGGQKQRIAIARALLAKPDIIIFDEATSSLDSESELAIQKAVFSIKNKTMIIIAHRLSTVEHADQIVVIKNGKVAEVGSHHDLSTKKKGLYSKMRSLQSLGELRS